MLGALQVDYLAKGVLKAMTHCEREISKEQYEQAEKGNWDAIFTDAEWMGYGIYGPTLHKEIDQNGFEKYTVTFSMGSSCD